MAASAGQGVASTTDKSHSCANCTKTEQSVNMFPRCSECKLVRYCSRQCQRKHWEKHKVLCNSIKEFKLNSQPPAQEFGDYGMYVSHLTPRKHAKIVGLVGKRCLVQVRLNGHHVHVLWDTEAQVSLVSKRWPSEHFPELPIRNIASLLNEGTELDLKAANGTSVPYEGWVELDCGLETADTNTRVRVPMLVTREILNLPIIGYNVIEVIKGHEIPNHDIQNLADSFTNLNPRQLESLVNLIRTPSEEELCDVRTIKQYTIIPSETTVRVKCRANTGPVSERIPVLFEPSDDEQAWPSGLQIHEELTTIPSGSK